MSNKIIGYRDEHWEQKTWNGLTRFDSLYIWTDGTDTYYSNGDTQYVLNKTTGEWEQKIWTGLWDPDKLFGYLIKTDGTDIYHIDFEHNINIAENNIYRLNKATGTWEPVTWNNVPSNFNAAKLWTDGSNLYYSADAHYMLNKATNTWESKIWNGNTAFDGLSIWTDGDNIYSSAGTSHYVLNRATDTWEPKVWNNVDTLTDVRFSIWTDGTDIYYSAGYNKQYKLNKATDTWETKIWLVPENSDIGRLAEYDNNIIWVGEFSGAGIWTDGTTMYYSSNSNQYVLVREPIYAKDLPEYLDKQGLATVIDQIKSNSANEFVGTQAEWDALTPEEQNAYDKAYIKKENEYIGSEEAWNALTAEEQNAYSKAYFV